MDKTATKKKKVFLKVVIIGDSGVGKTSLIHRYTSTKFLQEFKPTIGAEFANKELLIDGRTVVAQIWDTAGQERYQSLGVSFYRGADCWGIVFDRSDRETFEHLDQWRQAFMQHGAPGGEDKFPFIVMGNKSDLTEEVLVRNKEVEEWWEDKEGWEYIEVSAKDNTSVEEAFHRLIEKGAKRESKNDYMPRRPLAQGKKLSKETHDNKINNGAKNKKKWC